MRPSLLPIVAAVLAGGCAAPAPAVEVSRDAVARMELPGCPLIPARLDGLGVDLVLDTGSEVSLVDASLADRLGPHLRARWFPRRFDFIEGQQFSRRYAAVDRLALDGIAFGPLELPLVDLGAGGVGGDSALLGCDVLRQIRILFEAGSSDMRFLAARTPDEVQQALRDLCPGRAFVPLEVRWIGARPHVEVSQGAGPPATFLVDSGALQTFVSEETLRGWDPERPALLDGLENNLVEDLSIGPWRVWLIANVEASSCADALGFDVLSSLTFLWDGPGSKLWIAEPLSGEPGAIAIGSSIEHFLRVKGVDLEAR